MAEIPIFLSGVRNVVIPLSNFKLQKDAQCDLNLLTVRFSLRATFSIDSNAIDLAEGEEEAGCRRRAAAALLCEVHKSPMEASPVTLLTPLGFF